MIPFSQTDEDIVLYRINMSQIWGQMKGKILIISATIDLGGEHGDSVGEGEWSITPKIMSLLNQLYPGEVLEPVLSGRVRDFYPNDKWKDFNLVLIGGPESNEITKEALNGSDDFLKNPFTNYSIEVPSLGKKEAKISTQPARIIEEDWGVLIKHISPFSEQKRIYIFAGCRSCGTLAAATGLIEPKLSYEIAKKFGNGGIRAFIQATRTKGVFETRMQIVYPFRSEIILNPRALIRIFEYICKMSQENMFAEIAKLPIVHLVFISLFSFILGICIILSYNAIYQNYKYPYMGYLGVLCAVIGIIAFSLDLKKMWREYAQLYVKNYHGSGR